MALTGIDPMAQRKDEKIATENSFQNIASFWVEHWQDGKSPRHVDSTKRRLTADILPSLGARPIDEIEAPELVAMTKALEQRGARDIAKRALETNRANLSLQHRPRICKGATRLAKSGPATS